ncbi:PREDICTED: uncharacterized protein LOC103086200 [Lipotes vexillifer]|uniref:Uncharacterized protein LOC103086200 n=1 Tax=Lipotes vexillifer TaxID=118797 RepID=A0A340WFH5_LIPVE|nr:PREDICTED: uncharacterized protein LOC103086200 [Lipotes vexillifer]
MNMGKRPISPPPTPPQVLENRAVFVPPEVNENSLKRLSAYLENLQKPGFKSLKPTQLMFYVRETDQNSSDGQEHFSTSGFRAVKFTLHTRDLLSTVLYILNSCSLSIEHIQSLNTNVHSQPLKEAKRISDRPIKWDKSYYSFTGFKDPDEDPEQVWRMETTLTYCVQMNKNLGMSDPPFGVEKKWDWRRLMLLEDQISYLLGGIQVVYIEELQPVLTLEEYYSLLDVFYNRLLKSRIPFHPRSLRAVQGATGRKMKAWSPGSQETQTPSVSGVVDGQGSCVRGAEADALGREQEAEAVVEEAEADVSGEEAVQGATGRKMKAWSPGSQETQTPSVSGVVDGQGSCVRGAEADALGREQEAEAVVEEAEADVSGEEVHALAQLEQGQWGLPEQSGWSGKADWHCQVPQEEQEGCHPSRFSQQYPDWGKVSSAPC